MDDGQLTIKDNLIVMKRKSIWFMTGYLWLWIERKWVCWLYLRAYLTKMMNLLKEMMDSWTEMTYFLKIMTY